MFEISSLDMYKDSSRMKNIMALRFNQIMNGMFTGDKSIIINNAPQIRYRPVVIEKKDVHPVGSRLVNKIQPMAEPSRAMFTWSYVHIIMAKKTVYLRKHPYTMRKCL